MISAAPPAVLAASPLALMALLPTPALPACPALALLPAAWQLRWAVRGPPGCTVPGAVVGPPVGFGGGAVVAVLTPECAGLYDITLDANHTGYGALRATTTVQVVACADVTVDIVVHGDTDGLASLANATLCLSFRPQCLPPTGYHISWQYAGPDGRWRTLLPISPGATEFRLPWPPGATGLTTLAVGPFAESVAQPGDRLLGSANVTLLIPPCPPACAALPLWTDPAAYRRCLQCPGHPSPADHYLTAYALPALRNCSSRPAAAISSLLEAVRDAVMQAEWAAVDAPPQMEALVVAVMRCGPQPWRALETLTDIVGEALWANGRGNLSDRMPAIEQLMALLEFAVRRNAGVDHCTLPVDLTLDTPRLSLTSQRLMRSGPLRLAVGGVAVSTPPLESILPDIGEPTVDFSMWTLTTPMAPAVSPVVSLTFLEVNRTQGFPVEELETPISLDFPLATAPLRQPVADWYECAYTSGTGWATSGVWLTPQPAGVTCHTTHLSTFAVLPVVRVLAVAGCALDVAPTTLLCTVGARLTITGGNFGMAGARVSFEAANASVAVPWACDAVIHQPGQEDSVLVCQGLRGSPGGEAWAYLKVTQVDGLNGTSPLPLSFRAPPTLSALTAPAGSTCQPRSPTELANCSQTGAWFGVWGTGLLGHVQLQAGPFRCASLLPFNDTYVECLSLPGAGAALPLTVAVDGLPAVGSAPLALSFADPCAWRAGWWMAPACVDCAPGVYGLNCSRLCPGMVGPGDPLCGGHGVCASGTQGSGRCLCGANPLQGFWAGDACDDCQAGYAGPNCTVSCPTSDPNRTGAPFVCSGSGRCDSGVNGSGACRCVAGYAGPACSLLCPFAAQQVCGGHGRCVEGPDGPAGRCACAADPAGGFWAGAACDGCAAGYGGPNCTAACPANCSGHGECLSPEAALCACYSDWGGPTCAEPCPWADGAACGGHGACAAGGGCRCANASDVGHWEGPNCTACAAGWAGPSCTLQCPADPATGAPCGGRGRCEPDGSCRCEAGSCGRACETTGVACTLLTCLVGFYGPQCANACNCTQHAVTCIDGPYGSGTCLCEPGWAGPRCELACEGGTTVPVCGGHGACDATTGRCGCQPDWRTAAAGQPCAVPCPGPAGTPCHGHGQCTPAGQCTCDVGYGGRDCGAQCPGVAGPAMCGGHGVCDGSSGACLCDASPVTGFWAPDSCSSCAAGYQGPGCNETCHYGSTVGQTCLCWPGYAGPSCALPCPGAPASVCAGHGVCDGGPLGTGACVCQPGYAGAGCDLVCPGGPTAPCSGHGACDTPSATCRCADDAVAGHWAGTACDVCRAPWGGPDCQEECPVSPSGQVCSGRGACNAQLLCDCTANFGGPLCAGCRPGYYGVDCNGTCAGGACNPCGGHGRCSDGPLGTGQCTCWADPHLGFFGGPDCSACAAGYYGAACAARCSPAAALPCAGHGTCADGVAGTGDCRCYRDPLAGYWDGSDCGDCLAGYFGPACTAPCSAAGGGNCSSHGLCDGGVAGTGRCRCANGYVGDYCNVTCPTANDTQPCGGHGVCLPLANGTAACACADGWAGPACEACEAGAAGPQCALRCPADCGGHGRCDDGVAGTGRCACDGGWGGSQCDAQCPGPTGTPCNARGTCQPDGTCLCLQSPALGYWAGPECLACAPGYSGDSCRDPCPVADDGLVCAGHGSCFVGICLCDDSYCGPLCNVTGSRCPIALCEPSTQTSAACLTLCPSEGGALCAGHGVCAAAAAAGGGCLCAEGWAGPACGRPCPGQPVCSRRGFCNRTTAACDCLPGFVGPNCSLECPGGWQTPCSGRGACGLDTRSAPACACEPGYVGPDCSRECPGGATSPCGGHGQCQAANLSCVCADPWAGDACQDCAAGWFGAGCDQRCYQGTTVGRDCICFPNWAGPNCSRSCEGGALAPCGGHGVCNATHLGDGSCRCADGWQGPACLARCPGLLSASGAVCGGHGWCTEDAVCVCGASRATGYWAGDDCSVCAPKWYGVNCDRTCSLGDDSAAVCGGHGVCQAATETCQCYHNATAGYWAADSNCTRCAANYFGPQCQAACPAVDCVPCGGHGACSDGRWGTGLCACDGGWQGATCTDCLPGHFGPLCEGLCPGALDWDRGVFCGGHGECQAGPAGTGQCACAAGNATGDWAGPNCTDCAAGYFGGACQARCPGLQGVPCSGRGTCRDGRGGSGRCICDPGYGGVGCALACPSNNGLPCNGNGVCDDGETGTLLCNCSAAPRGHWMGTACDACADLYVGTYCDLLCPATGPAAVCANHGVCLTADRGGEHPVCSCDDGWAGPYCTTECPGSAALPCHGHGRCDSLSAQCTCYDDAVRGHWAGAACDRCANPWSAVTCLAACPVDPTGLACSGAPCYDGTCICGVTACGLACEITNTTCDLFACPDGYYGEGCRQACPGAPNRTCSTHGFCIAKVYGTGRCFCDDGYAGADCSIRCAASSGLTCSGHGSCVQATGQCLCDALYATTDCSVPCPLYNGLVCGGRGVCNATAQGDGTCRCAAGYGRADCSGRCPASPSNASLVCSGHGVCDGQNATCVCAVSAAGHWGGAACDRCAAGYFGASCGERCVHGVTDGRTCSCLPGFAGYNCSVACPEQSGHLCSGHGVCQDGNTGDGTCVCEAGWYGPACGVFCDPSACYPSDTYPEPHAQCNPATGACECQRNASGYWYGSQCAECQPQYWGVDCDRLCLCSNKGTCGRLDGECLCYQDPTEGYWAGAACDECSAGYLAPLCRARDVAITRAGELSAITYNSAAVGQGVIVVDEAYSLAYTGGLPLQVLSTRDSAPVGAVPLPGVVQAGCVMADAVVFLVQHPTTLARSIQRVARGPHPLPLRPVATTLARRRRTAGRAMAPLAALLPSDVQPFFAIHGLNDQLLSVALQPSGFSLNAYAADLSLGFAAALPATSLQLTAVRWSGVWQPPALAVPVLLLAGQREDSWALVSVTVEPTPQVVPLTSLEGTNPCTNPTALAAVGVWGAQLVLVLEQPSGVCLLRIASGHNASTATVLQGSVMDWLGVGVRVTAAYLDPQLPALFFSWHTAGNPSTVYKVALDTLLLYGQRRLLVRASAPEVVGSLAADGALRQLLALTVVGGQPLVVQLLLYAVTAVAPPLGDVQGGTALQLAGEGIANISALRCVFAGGLHTTALWLSPVAVRCVTPPVNASSTACEGDAVELALLPPLVTDNGVALRRVPTPAIIALAPDAGFWRQPQWVTVRGYGFVDSAELSCRFYNDQVAVDVHRPDVQFVSATEVLCRQPAFVQPLGEPSYLDLSLDGQVYSATLTHYGVIGDPVALEAGDGPQNVRAAAMLQLPPLTVLTVDSSGHAVQRFDAALRVVRAALQPTEASPDSGSAVAVNQTITLSAGTGQFLNLTIARPAIGEYVLQLESPPLRPVAVMYYVVAGTASELYVIGEPSAVTLNTLEPLAEQPLLGLRDSAGNAVPGAELVAEQLQAVVVPPMRGLNLSFVASLARGQFQFTGVVVLAEYGVEYRLKFAFMHASVPVPPLLSRPIVAQPCGLSEFFLPGATTCRPCVPGAVCNGTSILVTAPNHWRGDPTTLTFLECGEAQPCLGGALTALCRPQFRGPLCAVCVAGHAGADCAACGEPTGNLMIAAGLGLLYVAVVGGTIVAALRKDEHSRPSPFLVCGKILLTYAHCLIQLYPLFPTTVSHSLNLMQSGTTPSIPAAILDCLLPSLTTYHRFWGYMILPATALLFVALVMWVDATLSCRSLLQRRLLTADGREAAKRRSFTRGKKPWQIMVVCLSVVVYFVYPVLVQKIAQMNDCDRLDTGSGALRLLHEDYSIDCTTETYEIHRFSSFVFLFVYGLGIPLALAGAGWLITTFRGQAPELETLGFFMMGYQRRFRYWEVLNMMRKMGIIALVTFVGQPQLRVYSLQWLLMACLALQLMFSPFISRALNLIEVAELLVLVLTLNLALLWQDPLFGAGTAGDTALLAVILTANVLLLTGFVTLFFRMLGTEVAGCCRRGPGARPEAKATPTSDAPEGTPGDPARSDSETPRRLPIDFGTARADSLACAWGSSRLGSGKVSSYQLESVKLGSYRLDSFRFGLPDSRRRSASAPTTKDSGFVPAPMLRRPLEVQGPGSRSGSPSNTEKSTLSGSFLRWPLHSLRSLMSKAELEAGRRGSVAGHPLRRDPAAPFDAVLGTPQTREDPAELVPAAPLIDLLPLSIPTLLLAEVRGPPLPILPDVLPAEDPASRASPTPSAAVHWDDDVPGLEVPGPAPAPTAPCPAEPPQVTTPEPPALALSVPDASDGPLQPPPALSTPPSPHPALTPRTAALYAGTHLALPAPEPPAGRLKLSSLGSHVALDPDALVPDPGLPAEPLVPPLLSPANTSHSPTPRASAAITPTSSNWRRRSLFRLVGDLDVSWGPRDPSDVDLDLLERSPRNPLTPPPPPPPPPPGSGGGGRGRPPSASRRELFDPVASGWESWTDLLDDPAALARPAPPRRASASGPAGPATAAAARRGSDGAGGRLVRLSSGSARRIRQLLRTPKPRPRTGPGLLSSLLPGTLNPDPAASHASSSPSPMRLPLHRVVQPPPTTAALSSRDPTRPDPS